VKLRQRIRAFPLNALLVVIAIIALLISILLPSLSRARELSKRLVCQSNIKGIGTSAKIYANDNNERWMIPPFSRDLDLPGTERVDYFGGNTPVGYERDEPSYSRDPGASTQLSVTRAFWMLVRSGDVTPKQFICPSSGDNEDPTENIDFYYDFTEIENISYGYLVPFGPRDTQPREGVDNRLVMAADRGPFYLRQDDPDWESPETGVDLTIDDSPKNWRQYNSGNHGGSNNGEGQNCLFADGHAAFHRTPIVGLDHDNIYTVMTNDWGNIEGTNRIHGALPGSFAGAAPYPGDETFGPSAWSSTDTLIYP
jgi:prepilin-type processing-associated H-X9-DG protein